MYKVGHSPIISVASTVTISSATCVAGIHGSHASRRGLPKTPSKWGHRARKYSGERKKNNSYKGLKSKGLHFDI